jgi:ribosomal-protein-alanine N-acetyltransferase
MGGGLPRSRPGPVGPSGDGRQPHAPGVPGRGPGLQPGYRGRGLGTAAQRLLVDHLFRCTTVHRLAAGSTDADDVAEQKALERIGLTRDGVLREVAFRDGAWRHSLVYALLRQDWQRR